jgi:hypothetical protein
MRAVGGSAAGGRARVRRLERERAVVWLIDLVLSERGSDGLSRTTHCAQVRVGESVY